MTSTRPNTKTLGWWPLLIVLIAPCVAWLVWGRTRSKGPDLLAEAQSAYARQDWDRAAELARARLKLSGDDREALRLLARASLRLGRDRIGTGLYRDRLGVDALDAEDSFLLGMAALRQGDEQGALKVWSRSAEANQASPELVLALANVQARNGRFDEAIATARRLAAIPDWEAAGLLMIGTAQVSLEDHAAAIGSLKQGLERDPAATKAVLDAPVYRKLLARSLLLLGRPREADPWLEPLLKPAGGSDPDCEASWLASRSALQQGQIDRARAALALAGDYRAEHPLVPEPSPFAGSARCAPCHPEISKAHAATRHSRTFHHGAGLLALPRPDEPLRDPDHPRVTHTLVEDGKKLKMRTKAEDRLYEVVVDYAFGVEGRYITMVGRDGENHYRALRQSCYWERGKPRWGRTAGDAGDADPSRTVQGQLIAVRDGVVRCLYCHVTNFRAFRDPDKLAGGPEAADPGIGCERCHGPAAVHIRAAEIDFPDQAIVNVGRLSAEDVTVQCRDCHIVADASVIAKNPESPEYVRSPGATMTFSRCYTESSGGMSCLTCHDPHRDSERSPAFYEQKCLSCHSVNPEEIRSKGSFQIVACPVNPANDCLSCHMPKVRMPVLHTSLTDHYIRVHHEKPEAERRPVK
jgi:tetratricopeptide (TPR) repeat protein